MKHEVALGDASRQDVSRALRVPALVRDSEDHPLPRSFSRDRSNVVDPYADGDDMYGESQKVLATQPTLTGVVTKNPLQRPPLGAAATFALGRLF